MAERDFDPEAFDFAMPRTSTDPKQAGDFVRGAKYAPFDLLGAPVDIVNMAIGAVGVPVSDKPVMGSEFLIDSTTEDQSITSPQFPTYCFILRMPNS